MKANKEKIQAWRKAQREETEQREKIEKAIRRHNGTIHAFAAWGKAMSILNAIHAEIEQNPAIIAMRSAKDFLHYGNGKQSKAARR